VTVSAGRSQLRTLAPTVTGTFRLVRLIVRRDRIRLSLWIAGLIVLMAFSADQVLSLYDTAESIDNYVRTVGDNPALVIFAGPGYGFDDPSVGAILVNKTSLWMSLAAALMSIFLVNRHTRAEEDSERADLVRSLVVGRHASTVAVLIIAALANAMVVAGSAIFTVGAGFDTAGSLALCGSFGLVGLCFAAVAAISAQIAPTGRATLGLATGLLGLAFVVRGVGDVSAPALSWLTPFGWGIGVRAFAGERWWALAGLVALTAGLTTVAFTLSVRRDLGSGIVPQRPGRPSAPNWVTHPAGLAFRLQRASVLGWSAGVFLIGLVYGSIGDEVETMLEDNPQLADYLAQLEGVSITDSYLATALSMLAMLVSGFAVASALRSRSEESAGFAESMLATPMSRWAWSGGHLAVTVSGVVAVSLAAGLGVGVGYASVTGDGSQVARLVGAALATVPAVMVMVGVATALFGWLPRLTVAAWMAFAIVLVIGLFGRVLGLPEWVRSVSPFEHVPAVPAESASALSVVGLLAVAGALVGAGMIGFRRRDVAAT
jgi:ABC-2 type transport system permease protein